MAEAGIDDILISYNLLGDEKMARLGALQAKANMTVAADNSTVVAVADLPKAAAASGRPLSVVVECDTGRKRAGVETPAEAIALAREIAASKGLQFARLHALPDRDRLGGGADASMTRRWPACARSGSGSTPAMVSTGGSPNLKNLGKLKGATEHRPGTYIYNDRMQVAAGVADLGRLRAEYLFDRGEPRRPRTRHSGCRLQDADLRHRQRGLEGHGLILEHPEAKIAKFAEEHGFLDLARSNTRPRCRRCRADRTQPRLRRRQHDGRGRDGAR